MRPAQQNSNRRDAEAQRKRIENRLRTIAESLNRRSPQIPKFSRAKLSASLRWLFPAFLKGGLIDFPRFYSLPCAKGIPGRCDLLLRTVLPCS